MADANVEEKIDRLVRASEETRAAVLDLQRFLKAPEAEAIWVRSCTSCLQDSCNKEPKVTASQN